MQVISLVQVHPVLSKLSTIAFRGIDAVDISVEVQIASGLPTFVIVGLPDKSIAESKERIRASFSHIGLSLPPRRIIVNLAPSDLQKEGAHYDLPIALGILSAVGVFDATQLQEYIILGSLSLDAKIAPVAGILPAAIRASSTQRGLICPYDNQNEALWAGKDLRLLASPDLLALVNHFKGTDFLPVPQLPPIDTTALSASKNFGDMADVKGQAVLKRVFEIAAVGRHNVLMLGPPGAGKSMMAQRMVSILPRLSAEESIETTMIYSLAGMLPEQGLVAQRPYRAPHHSASLVSLVGGGLRAKPGEISLAHNGVLFLDELPEFSRPTLEALRQPLENHTVTIARANQHVTYPANIQLIAAMNPCRCGYFGQAGHECARAPRCAEDYQSKISGPLLDRFDLRIYVPPVPVEDFLPAATRPAESSETIRARVEAAVNFRQQRLDSTHDDIGSLDEEVQACLRHITSTKNLSARGYTRLLSVSRSLADLEASPNVQKHHIQEAIHYRLSAAQNFTGQ